MNSQTRLFASAAWILGCGALPAAATQQCLASEYLAGVSPAQGTTEEVVCADFDGDGIDDTWVANPYGPQLRILLGSPSGPSGTATLNVGYGSAALAFGDVDGDGDQDALVALQGQLGATGYANDGLRFLRNDGAGQWVVGPLLPFAPEDNRPVAAFLEDVNGDGELDAVVVVEQHATFTYGGGVVVAFGDGHFGLLPGPVSPLPSKAIDADVGDFDGDGALDVAVLHGISVTYSWSVAFGAGNGSFVSDPAVQSGGLYASSIVAGDFDADGAVDIAVGSKYSLTTFRNDGAGAFSSWTSAFYGYYIKGMATGDLDGDGDLDLVATFGNAKSIQLFSNDGSGAFAKGQSFPAAVQCYALGLGDTNGDGILDLWASDYDNSGIYRVLSHCIVERYGVAKQNGAGGFPAMGAAGLPSASTPGFTIQASGLPSAQTAWLGFSLTQAEFPLLGGTLLLGFPLNSVVMVTGPGSGNPLIADGDLSLAVPAQALASLGVGGELFAQVFAIDLLQTDGTYVAITDGLRFEVIP